MNEPIAESAPLPPRGEPPASPPLAASDETRENARSGAEVGVFDTLEAAFWWIGAGPAPLTIHPRGFTDLPSRPLSLTAIRARLSSPATSPHTRAAIWTYLVTQARTPGARQTGWSVGAAGVALPELMRIVGALARGYDGERADLEAAALGGFLAELRRTDLPQVRDHRLRRRLLMAAYRAARGVRDTTHTSTQPSAGTTGTLAPRATAPADATPARPAETRDGRARLPRRPSRPEVQR